MNKPIAKSIAPAVVMSLALLAGCACNTCDPVKTADHTAAQGQAPDEAKAGREANQAAGLKVNAVAGASADASAAAPEPPAQEPEGKSPSFMIDEAKLPQGFPGPGPVGQVVVKTYPAARVALFAPDDNRSGDDMFMPLFRHIERNNVPMTSPVEMTFKPIPGEEKRFRSVSMAFVYPDKSTGKVGTDKDVVVQDIGPLTVLSVGFRGGYGRSSFIEGYDKIQAFMSENPGKFKPAGPARLMAYNSPFVPFFLKYGEVQLPVEITSP